MFPCIRFYKSEVNKLLYVLLLAFDPTACIVSVMSSTEDPCEEEVCSVVLNVHLSCTSKHVVFTALFPGNPI